MRRARREATLVAAVPIPAGVGKRGLNIFMRQQTMHLGNSIKAHNEWKDRFRAALSGEAVLDASTISADNRCELGRWLYGDGGKFFGALPGFADCVMVHKLFHREAGKIARLINARNFSEAKAMLNAQTPFADASGALAAAIAKLKQDAVDAPGFASLIAKLSDPPA